MRLLGSRQWIYVANADGSGLHRLTRARPGATQPSWSPDGRWIAFAAAPDADGLEVYVVRSDGRGSRRRVTHLKGPDPSSLYPTWSPDSRRIAFMHYVDSHLETQCCYRLWVVNADGTAQRPLALPASLLGEFPAWSPGGHWIAFVGEHINSAGESIGDESIYRVRPDGSDLQRLGAAGIRPAWSPDGRALAYLGGGVWDTIYVMNADGSHKRLLRRGLIKASGDLAWGRSPAKR